MTIEFTSSSPVVVYISSEAKRPDRMTAEKILYKSDKYNPTIRSDDDPLKDPNGGQICYLTAQALEGATEGELKIWTEINLHHLGRLVKEGKLYDTLG